MVVVVGAVVVLVVSFGVVVVVVADVVDVVDVVGGTVVVVVVVVDVVGATVVEVVLVVDVVDGLVVDVEVVDVVDVVAVVSFGEKVSPNETLPFVLGRPSAPLIVWTDWVVHPGGNGLSGVAGVLNPPCAIVALPVPALYGTPEMRVAPAPVVPVVKPNAIGPIAHAANGIGAMPVATMLRLPATLIAPVAVLIVPVQSFTSTGWIWNCATPTVCAAVSGNVEPAAGKDRFPAASTVPVNDPVNVTLPAVPSTVTCVEPLTATVMFPVGVTSAPADDVSTGSAPNAKSAATPAATFRRRDPRAPDPSSPPNPRKTITAVPPTPERISAASPTSYVSVAGWRKWFILDDGAQSRRERTVGSRPFEGGRWTPTPGLRSHRTE